jgi:Domain of unknown function (DUF4124)
MLSFLGKGYLLPRMALTSASGSRLAFLAFLLLIHSGWARAEIYTWIDRDGQVHITDEASVIPPEYRDRVQTRPSSPPLESPPPPAASKKSEKHRRTKPLSSSTALLEPVSTWYPPFPKEDGYPWTCMRVRTYCRN